MEKVKGKSFLMLMGILLILAGIYSIFETTMLLIELTSIGVFAGALVGTVVCSYILGALLLITGILGLVKSLKPGKATICVVLGVLLVIIAIALVIIEYKFTTAINIKSIIYTVCVPVLYVVAAILKK